jgi:hypothetical protein
LRANLVVQLVGLIPQLAPLLAKLQNRDREYARSQKAEK